MSGLAVEVAAGSVVGNRYPENFDVHSVTDRCVAVADGMGAGEGSRTAGRTTIDTFTAAVGDGAADADALRAAVADVQRRVRAAGARLPDLCGCTLTALVLSPVHAPDPHEGGVPAWLVHIGDSRAYRLRTGDPGTASGDQMELLTVDHTMAWLGLVHGWYPADSPQARSARYHLLRYVGHPDEPEPDVQRLVLRPGDTLCLCTDGVADQIDFWRLAGHLRRREPLSRIVEAVLADTLDAGGHDNATVALLRVTSGAAPGTPKG